MTQLLSFQGNPDLRAGLLAQMQAQARTGRLAPVLLAGRLFPVFALGCPPEVPAGAAALSLPPELLQLGFYLFDGFPETLTERRAFIELRREMLAAFPVGQDLSAAAGRFCYHLLKEPAFGVADLLHTPESAALRREVLDALSADPCGAFLDADLRQRLQAEQSRQADKVTALWRAEHREDRSILKTLRALETLAAVSRLPVDYRAAAEAVEKSIYGAFGVNAQPTSAKDDQLRALFKHVLAA